MDRDEILHKLRTNLGYGKEMEKEYMKEAVDTQVKMIYELFQAQMDHIKDYQRDTCKIIWLESVFSLMIYSIDKLISKDKQKNMLELVIGKLKGAYEQEE